MVQKSQQINANLKGLQIPVLVSLEFPLNYRPTHRFLDSLIVIRDLNPGDRILEIFVFIGPESRVNHSADTMELANVPANPVKNKSKAVFMWI